MDRGNLAAFLAVYDSGSITKAAQRLYMSPQGLSKAIARLEKELRVQLFVRSPQGVEPTRHAKAIYPKAKDLAETLESVREEAANAEPRQRLSVVLSDGMFAYLGLDFVSAFEAAHPDVELDVQECSNRAVEDFLREGQAEVGFLVGPVNERDFSCTFFQSVPHVLVVSDESALSQKEAVAFSDLRDQTVFHLGCDYPVGKSLAERLDAAGVAVRAQVGVVGADTVLPYVMRNEGVLVSAEVWAVLSQRPGLRVVPFEDRSFAWNVFLAQRRGMALSRPAQEFASFVFDWKAALSGQVEAGVTAG